MEQPATTFHVTVRAERSRAIWSEDAQRSLFLTLLGEVAQRFEWRVHAYVLLLRHYHLLVDIVHPNLPQGLRQLGELYLRASRHRGPLFQRRPGMMRVAGIERLLDLNRYVVLSPVRLGYAAMAKDWAWSSYRAAAGLAPPPPWLAVDELLSFFDAERERAVVGYVGFVAAGLAPRRPKLELLGSEPPPRLATQGLSA